MGCLPRQLLSRRGTASGGGELAGKEGSSSPAAGLRWYKRPSRVIPVLAGGEAEPPPYHHDPGTEQLLMETVCKGEKYARDWGRMLLGLPETASPAGLEVSQGPQSSWCSQGQAQGNQVNRGSSTSRAEVGLISAVPAVQATLLAPGLAMLRVGLRLAFARLPEHLEAHNLRQLLDAIPLRLERALCSWHGCGPSFPLLHQTISFRSDATRILSIRCFGQIEAAQNRALPYSFG